MIRKITVSVLILLVSQQALATQCKRPIKKIFTGYTASTSKIHVDHGDGYAASVVRLPHVNNDEKIVDRILSVLLAAHLGGREVTFRYSQGEDGSAASCSPTVSQLTQAVWIE
jgi:hypothetical protein